MDLTHASFFSGVGGLDLGLERAGFRTVSFSEIDPYANAVLAERWPEVPNLGDITALAANVDDGRERDRRLGGRAHARRDGLAGGVRLASDGGLRQDGGYSGQPRDGHPYERAALWTAGFPCQDLSVAGKRRGFGVDYELDPDDDPEHAPDIERQVATRSGLAFAFLDLVADVRPAAILLENVPGLLSSHGGRDLYTLLRALGQLGYGWAYRVLDARYFGVPQRRRRVFICALDAGRGLGAVSAAEVLSVGHRCARHPATGHQAGPGAAERAAPGVDIARAVTGTSGKRHDDDTDTLIAAAIRGNPYGDHIAAESHLVSASPDAGGVRAPDGLARGAHDRSQLEAERQALDAYALEPSDGGRHATGHGAWAEAGTADVPADGVRDLRDEGNAVTGSQRRQPTEQRARERMDLVQAVSRDLGVSAREIREAAQADPSAWGAWADRTDLADTLNSGGNNGGFRTEPGAHLIAFVKHSRYGEGGDPRRPDGNDAETWGDGTVSPSLDSIGHAPRTATAVLGSDADDDPLLPLGLDSHRYRCAGNGVVAPVAEYIGARLRAALESA